MTSARTLHSRTDAIVVGARCAGAATAMLLARRGLQVLLVDRSAYGSDALSTHALMRAGVLQLHRWGVLDRLSDAGTPAIHTTSFHYGEEVLEIPIKARDGVDALFAPRRTLLDAQLVDAARRSGVEVRHGIRLTDLLRSADGRVRGAVIQDRAGVVRNVEAGIVIGADGLKSTVARLAEARTLQAGEHATALVYGYWSGLQPDGYRWYYNPEVSAGAIPTNEGLTCIFVATPPTRHRDEIRRDIVAGYHRVLGEAAPSLAPAVARARMVGALRSFSGAPGYLRQAWGPGWALVGDAAYFKDPLTAHGMTDALRDAELLARAVAEDTDEALAAYQSTRDALSLPFLRTSDDIASFAWDLSTVKQHHLALSRCMRDEVALLTRSPSEAA